MLIVSHGISSAGERSTPRQTNSREIVRLITTIRSRLQTLRVKLSGSPLICLTSLIQNSSLVEDTVRSTRYPPILSLLLTRPPTLS